MHSFFLSQADRRSWKEPALVSSEDSAALRIRGSPPPSSQQSDGVLSEACVRQQSGELSTAGVASCAAKGSCSSIPYIDCSDAEISEMEVRGQVRRSHSRTHHRHGSLGHWPGDDASRLRECKASPNRIKQRESHSVSPVIHTPPPLYPSPTQTSSPTSHSQNYEVYEWSLPGGVAPVRGILHSTLLDELATRSPGPIRHLTGTRSLTSSPALFSHHRTGSFSHTRYNGHGQHEGMDGLAICGRSFSLRSAAQEEKGKFFSSCSPIMNRSINTTKCQNVGNRSETDPLILSQPRPIFPRAERMAALERRMLANGLSPLGQAKASGSPHRRHSAMQMIDGSTSSGTDTSDSEEMESTGSCSQSLGFSNPGVHSSPVSHLPRNKLSFGSLQLDEDGEGGVVDFSDEEGAQVFNC